MMMQVQSLISLSGLRIQCCHELWYRPVAAAAPVWLLAWELRYATGAALEREKKKKKKERNFRGRGWIGAIGWRPTPQPQQCWIQSCICNLCQSLWQIFNPQSKARDQSPQSHGNYAGFLTYWARTGIPRLYHFVVFLFPSCLYFSISVCFFSFSDKKVWKIKGFSVKDWFLNI